MSPIRVGWRFARLFKMFIGRFNKPLNHVNDPIHGAVQSLCMVVTVLHDESPIELLKSRIHDAAHVVAQ